MYRSFFKLTRSPFSLTPDPVSFVGTNRHNEALAALYHGVRQHKGFVVLTGEVGTGKTLLVRCLLQLLKESKDIAYAYLFNGKLAPTEFLQYVLSDFGLAVDGKSKYELLLDLGRFLAARGARKLTTVLIVDEAHHLSADILEEVRLLSNLETTDDKLLQIVLVGQPELDEKLDSFDLRQLKQRIAVRTQLGALDEIETKQYIVQRLQIAGTEPESSPLFSDESVDAVYLYSQGLPRLINTICENSLIAAYAERAASVAPEHVLQVAREFRLDASAAHWGRDAVRGEQIDVHHAMKALLDLFAALKEVASVSHSELPSVVRVSADEPHI
jgi:type II secretory pathway predicted ATPase ExeA